jgi:hypothetical protein
MPFSWSYSALNAYETCPRKYYHTRVAKDVTEEVIEAREWGDQVHKAAEASLKHGTPIPKEYSLIAPVVQKVRESPGETFAEREFVLNNKFKPSTWWGEDAWVRCKVDAMKLQGTHAVLLDYKTGKMRPETDQLKLFTGVVLCHEPEIETVTTGFVWVKHGTTTVEKYTRDDLPWIWSEFLPRVKRMEKSYETNTFEVRPSGLCKKHCPVKSCEFNGRHGT